MEDVKTVEKFPRGLWLLAVTSFAAAILLFQGAVYLVADFHPDRAAIGQEIRRQTVFDSYEVGYITPTRGGQSSFDQMKADGLTPVLWIGASHLYTIVNFQKDDRNSSWWVNNAAKEDGSRYRFLQYGMGNLNLNEALFILL